MDKRRYARLIAQMEVTVKKANAGPLEDYVHVVSKDISVGGIGLVSEGAHAVGDSLKMVIKLSEEQVLHVVGVVKWVTERENLYRVTQKDYLVGVEFTEISDEDRRTIDQLVSITQQ